MVIIMPLRDTYRTGEGSRGRRRCSVSPFPEKGEREKGNNWRNNRKNVKAGRREGGREVGNMLGIFQFTLWKTFNVYIRRGWRDKRNWAPHFHEMEERFITTTFVFRYTRCRPHSKLRLITGGTPPTWTFHSLAYLLHNNFRSWLSVSTP